MLDHPFWSRGFRPFFLGGALHAALVVPLWTGIWLGALPPPRWLAPAWWHGHEMLFGTVAAAIAGFLLTASPVWAGSPALRGGGLAALFGLWMAGRLAMLGAGALPAPLVAAVDAAFLPALALVLARTLRGRAQRRNHGIVAVVGALALANAAVHADALGFGPGWAPQALRAAVDGVVVLIAVIGGRITPAFTANALRRAGVSAELRSHAWLERTALVALLAFVLADLALPRTQASGLLACAAALALAARASGWQTLRSAGDPLLWSLHAGMAWLVLGLILVGASDLGAPIAATAGLHALTAGAMGAMILAVTTRVALGHTGRPLVPPRRTVAAYALVHAGAAARVAAAWGGDLQAPLLLAAGLLWAGAFGVYAVRYASILLGPRADGQPD